VLEKAGGAEFKDEVKKLSESHGPLELATGKNSIRYKGITSCHGELCQVPEA